MVGCVKYGLDCWMMDVEGKCSADAVARGLPACMWAEEEGIRAQEVERGAMEDGVGGIAGQSAEEPEDKGEWGKIKARPE